jgi:hypothetical protein
MLYGHRHRSFLSPALTNLILCRWLRTDHVRRFLVRCACSSLTLCVALRSVSHSTIHHPEDVYPPFSVLHGRRARMSHIDIPREPQPRLAVCLPIHQTQFTSLPLTSQNLPLQ